MAGYRFLLQYGLAVSLGLIAAQASRSQTIPPVEFTGPISRIEALPVVAGAACGQVKASGHDCGSTCKIYALADFADDPVMCKWIADTIPQMIQPGCWSGMDGKLKLSYFPPGKLLVINQTPAVHAKVDEFLQGVKKSLPPKTMAARTRHDPLVMPAQFMAPDNTRPLNAQQYQAGYPVPYPPAAPKHLFHFIIRYEGAGIIDSNVAKFAKALSGQTQARAMVSESIPSAVAVMPTAGADPIPATAVPVDAPRYSPPAPGGPPAPGRINVRPRTIMPPADAPPGVTLPQVKPRSPIPQYELFKY